MTYCTAVNSGHVSSLRTLQNTQDGCNLVSKYLYLQANYCISECVKHEVQGPNSARQKLQPGPLDSSEKCKGTSNSIFLFFLCFLFLMNKYQNELNDRNVPVLFIIHNRKIFFYSGSTAYIYIFFWSIITIVQCVQRAIFNCNFTSLLLTESCWQISSIFSSISLLCRKTETYCWNLWHLVHGLTSLHWHGVPLVWPTYPLKWDIRGLQCKMIFDTHDLTLQTL